MQGNCVGFTVSSSSIVVAKKNPRRKKIVFSCGNTGGTGSVVLKNQLDASATNGIPLGQGQTLEFEGALAGHQWSAIRLVAADTLLGVVEGFDENEKIPVGGES